MSKKLFVGSLSWGTNDEGLRQAFERFGEVTDAKVITERDTGRSRGFGFCLGLPCPPRPLLLHLGRLLALSLFTGLAPPLLLLSPGPGID